LVSDGLWHLEAFTVDAFILEGDKLVDASKGFETEN